MVMKISEIELRRVYQLLRDWRGDIHPTDPNVNAIRRYGFWVLSSQLSKELRTIFLPCLDLVTEDIFTELKMAVTMLCPPRIAAFKNTGQGSKKKQKIDHKNTTQSQPQYNVISMRIVQPILSMLEHGLRADAHQGGQWTRGDNNYKFEQLLNPIGKLLFSIVPHDFPIPKDITDSYRYLIEGEGVNGSNNENDIQENIGGNVIGCLSALALVGGNEQLWKPLNHVIIEACGNDDNRSDVRRAGLICLLELIKSLGDEYIVLLPENLPLLSELLEDTNEDVARLARDVVTQTEELLGESLEDNLR
jgi:BP28CT (NUC211) domain